MNEIISINYESGNPSVSARELHEGLKIEKRFSAWFETNSTGFIENEDYTSVLVSTEVQNNGGVQIRDLQDYQLTVDMAKHICLMSRTEKGKIYRQYFLDLEKAWNTPEQIFARALKMANQKIDELKADKTILIEDVRRMKPKEVFADAVSASHTSILVGDLAKLLRQNGIDTGAQRLFEWLRNNGYLIKRKGTDWNMPTQYSMDMELFEIKESSHLDGNGCNVTTKTPKVTGKGQQYFINKFLSKTEGQA